jgi:hypothetical protein
MVIYDNQFFEFCETTIMKPKNWARVNQHPPMQQLAILPIGWAAFLHPVPDPPLTNQHCTPVNPFLAADF